MCIIQDYLYLIFKVICVAFELLENNNEWIVIFNNTIVFTTILLLYSLFVIALIHDLVVNLIIL